MDEEFKTTTSHVVIRAWAEDHGGKPALIVDPNRLDRRVGLRLDFPGKQDQALLSQSHQNKDVSWDEFFSEFEAQELAFDYLVTPGEADLVDAYRFVKREALKDKEVTTPFNPEAFAQAIRDDEPAFFTHDGQQENPHKREVVQDVTEDERGEGDLGSSTTNQDADDDTTQAAAEMGELEVDDPQAKHDRGNGS